MFISTSWLKNLHLILKSMQVFEEKAGGGDCSNYAF